MFQKSQNKEYIQVIVDRAKNDYLIWVEQFLDIIKEEINYQKSYVLNDIGCCVGQFWKGLKRRDIKVDYQGYDIEPLYIKFAVKLFPEKKDCFHILDITKEKPPQADISIISATLEHLDFYIPALPNVLETTKKLVIIRAFLGETGDKSICLKKGARMSYWVNQFSFTEILSLLDHYGFDTVVKRDRYTESLPKYLGDGIVRTQYVIVAKRR